MFELQKKPEQKWSTEPPRTTARAAALGAVQYNALTGAEVLGGDNPNASEAARLMSHWAEPGSAAKGGPVQKKEDADVGKKKRPATSRPAANIATNTAASKTGSISNAYGTFTYAIIKNGRS